MRIALLNYNHKVDFICGAEVISVELARSLSACPWVNGVDFLSSDILAETLADSLPQSIGPKARFVPLSQVETVYATAPPDIILLNSPGQIQHARYLRNSLKWHPTPIVSMLHSLSHLGLYQILAQALLEPDTQAGDTLWSPTECGKQAISGIQNDVLDRFERTGLRLTPMQIDVVPYGFDTQALAPLDTQKARLQLGIDIPSGGMCLLYLARIAFRDKMDYCPLLNMVAQLNRELPFPVHLIMAGADHLGESQLINQWSASHNLSDRVHVFPNFNVAQKPLFYAACDIFVSFSDSIQETYGLTLPEAMAAGRPVVVSDWNGYRETAIDGEVGLRIPTFMTPFRDSSAATALLQVPQHFHHTHIETVAVDYDAATRALTMLLTNHDVRLQMGLNARDHAVNQFSWPVVTERLKGVFERAIQQAQQQSPNSSGLPVQQFNIDRNFGHYSTAWLEPDHRMAVSFPGPPPTQAADLADQLFLPPQSETCQRIFQMYQAVLGEESGRPISDFADLNMDDDTRALVRAIKYGILKPVITDL